MMNEDCKYAYRMTPTVEVQCIFVNDQSYSVISVGPAPKRHYINGNRMHSNVPGPYDLVKLWTPPMELWMNVYPDGRRAYHNSASSARFGCEGIPNGKTVHFVEKIV